MPSHAAKPLLGQKRAGAAHGTPRLALLQARQDSPPATSTQPSLGDLAPTPRASLLTVTLRSQLKVGGQVGPGDKGQSELRRSCFHYLIYELTAPQNFFPASY